MATIGSGTRTSSELPSAKRPTALGALARAFSHLGPVKKLGPVELRRRVCHIAPGFLPFVLWPIPHRDPLSPKLMTIVVCLNVVLGVLVFKQYRHIERRGESNERMWACAGYACSVLLMLILFPGHAELAMTVLAVIAFGDGSATLGGLLIGGRRLPWNPNKTAAGFVCFLLFGTVMSSLAYWGEANNLQALPQSVPVTFGVAFTCGAVTTLAAAVVESIRSRVNDNVRVGVTAAVGVICVQTFVVGWT